MQIPVRQLGSTGISITLLGMGGWTIDWGGYPLGRNGNTPKQMKHVIRSGIDAGINWIDTASTYGLGASETVIGDILAELPESERPYVFTKGGVVWDASNPSAPASSILKASVIRAQCEESLKRLGVERLDLFQFHWPDELGTPVEESWATIQDLIAEGKVRFAGLSGFSLAEIERCEAVAHVDVVQDQLSLCGRQAAWAVLPWCDAHDTGFLAWGALDSGRLCAPVHADAAYQPLRPKRSRLRVDSDGHRHRRPLLAALDVIARRHGATKPAVAIAWTLAWWGVSGVAVGAHHPEEIGSWLPATEMTLTDEDMAELATALAVARYDDGPALPNAVLDRWHARSSTAHLV